MGNNDVKGLALVILMLLVFLMFLVSILVEDLWFRILVGMIALIISVLIITYLLLNRYTDSEKAFYEEVLKYYE